MARSSSAHTSRLTREATRLVTLSVALHNSGSRVEDTFWESEFGISLTKLMRSGNDSAIDIALEYLSKCNPDAYEVLIEQAETASESCKIEKDDQQYDVLLIVAPVVAWTRYSIPAPALSDSDASLLKDVLRTQVLAKGARIALMPQLASLDQMPRTFCETWDWMQKLGLQALGGTNAYPSLNQEPDAVNMLADTRYLVAAVAVPKGQAIFRWQETPGEQGEGRVQALSNWIEHARPVFSRILTGCGFEIILPDAFYVSNREADRQVRPLSVKAAILWLCSVLNVEPNRLRAIIAGCGENRVDEYRIGFTQKNQSEVIYGCLWPMYEREDGQEFFEGEAAQPDTQDEIVALIKECGISDIRRLPGILAPEFCEDCGAPYFPNPSGEMVHAELPEGAEAAPTHLH
ncbi:DUF2863 family protein [Orrella sp. NBD-18]|uniref:DUF2863 family protein n=1 Tax=Sheuella amnicola TaxID=2707330 RepID=A0A6B2QZR8_9BURK|nr:DUF2863 family protein [Sheuella amnicola]NDY82659.1 DUF2863 family protein [Sheuella amnicola]